MMENLVHDFAEDAHFSAFRLPDDTVTRRCLRSEREKARKGPLERGAVPNVDDP
jgi:hypothetical protein